MIAAGVRVGVIDSGWSPGLVEPRVQAGRGFCDPERPFELRESTDDADRLGHGTRCIQLILGAAPQASVTPLRVFHERLETSPAVLCAALRWARAQRFDVVSLSLATDREDARDALYLACEELRRDGTLIVASTRNGTHGGYPAVFESVIGVTLGGPDMSAADWSRATSRVELMLDCSWAGPPFSSLPGQALHSTSYATAYVAGIVAAHVAREGRVSLETLRARLPALCPPGSLARSGQRP